MVMRDEHIINAIGKITICVPRYTALIGIAQNRIEEHVDAFCLDQDACVAEVSPSHSLSSVWNIRWLGLRRQKRLHKIICRARNFKGLFDRRPWLRIILKSKQLIDPSIIKGQRKIQVFI